MCQRGVTEGGWSTIAHKWRQATATPAISCCLGCREGDSHTKQLQQRLGPVWATPAVVLQPRVQSWHQHDSWCGTPAGVGSICALAIAFSNARSSAPSQAADRVSVRAATSCVVSPLAAAPAGAAGRCHSRCCRSEEGDHPARCVLCLYKHMCLYVRVRALETSASTEVVALTSQQLCLQASHSLCFLLHFLSRAVSSACSLCQGCSAHCASLPTLCVPLCSVSVHVCRITT